MIYSKLVTDRVQIHHEDKQLFSEDCNVTIKLFGIKVYHTQYVKAISPKDVGIYNLFEGVVEPKSIGFKATNSSTTKAESPDFKQ